MCTLHNILHKPQTKGIQMKIRVLIATLLLVLFSTFAYAESGENTTEEDEYMAWAIELWNSLDRQTGTIEIPEAGATLQIPESFYYLPPADAEKVLVQVWGNPPGTETLGMIFPGEITPFDDSSWAVTIQYEEDGYVSDDDADDIDYSELLDQMKEDADASSKERIAQGYEPIELVGWAAQPYYDASSHKLHWAKEIKFGDQEINTLNYNIRVLGRKGVLVLNFIAGMDQKNMIESELDSVLALANFDDGARYSDFNPDIDKVAAYGLGALVAGKVIAKTGLIATALLLLKKFWIIIAVAVGGVFKGLKRNKTS
jgi:uncharacterized membrane-anchored protein